MERKTIAIIYMASGYGRRFGANKLLYPYKGKPLYRHCLDRLIGLREKMTCRQEEGGQYSLAACPFIRIYVVSQYKEIADYCSGQGLAYVANPDAAEGITGSIRHGIEAADRVDGYIFLTADQPELKEATLLSFIKHAVESEKAMGSICCKGQPGSPTYFAFSKREALLSLKGDQGGRSIMKASPQDVFWHEISEEEWKDVDLKEDLGEDFKEHPKN